MDNYEQTRRPNVPEQLDYILEKIQHLGEKVDVLDQRIEPIIAAYDSVIFGRKFLVGFSGFAAVMVGLGAGIIYVADFIKHYLTFK